MFISPFFKVVRGGDCCGSRIINEFKCQDIMVYKRDAVGSCIIDKKTRCYIIEKTEVFCKERIVADIKETIRTTNNPCFWWVQLKASQSLVLEEALYEVGFQKVACGENYNTGHTLHAYFFNAHPIRNKDSWQTKLEEKKDGSNK